MDRDRRDAARARRGHLMDNPDLQRRLDLMTGYVDCLLAAGENLAIKVADLSDTPWSAQILEEWRDAKDYLREMS